MQVKNLILSVPIVFCLKSNNFDNRIFFKNASLAYVNNCFVIYFDEIESFYNSFEVYINNEISTELKNIKRFNYIELPKLIYDKQNEVEIRLINNYEQKRLFFNINLDSYYDLSLQEEFKMNSLIDDYNKIFSLIDLQYFIIDNYCYEIINDQLFLEFDKIGRFIYNQDFSFSDEVIFKVNQQNLFYDLIYDEGYIFHLNLNNDLFLSYSHVDQRCLKGNNSFYHEDKLYIPVFSNDDLIEGEIFFTSFANSKITLKIDVVFDLGNILFGPFGEYEIYIKDR